MPSRRARAISSPARIARTVAGSPTVTPTRQLPATVTRCEAVYEKQLSFIGGAPVVRSVACGPAAP